MYMCVYVYIYIYIYIYAPEERDASQWVPRRPSSSDIRPISVQRFWISEGCFKHNLDLRGGILMSMGIS